MRMPNFQRCAAKTVKSNQNGGVEEADCHDEKALYRFFPAAHDPMEDRVILELKLPKPGGHVLSPDFGQIRRWAVREVGLEDYTWKISEAALHEEYGLDYLCICNIVDRILD